MLIIRNAQIEAFASVQREAFITHIVKQLREHNADQSGAMGDKDLQVLARTCLKKARSYNIVSEWAVTVFCRLALVHGVDFDTTVPDIDLVLENDRLDGNTKMELLEEALGYEPLEQDEAQGVTRD
jgi:hypothetical protein